MPDPASERVVVVRGGHPLAATDRARLIVLLATAVERYTVAAAAGVDSTRDLSVYPDVESPEPTTTW